MAFSIFHSSKELIKLLYSLSDCNPDTDYVFITGLWCVWSPLIKYASLPLSEAAPRWRACHQVRRQNVTQQSLSLSEDETWGEGVCGAFRWMEPIGLQAKRSPCDIEGHKWPQCWQDEKWYALTIAVSHATSLEKKREDGLERERALLEGCRKSKAAFGMNVHEISLREWQGKFQGCQGFHFKRLLN